MRHSIWILCVIMLLTGCQALQAPIPSARTPNEPVFAVTGAIAARNQEHAWTAHFVWTQHSPKAYQIIVYGPLGADTAEISQDQQGVTFRQGNKTVRAKHAEQLLARETGIRLPVDDLVFWIRGLPAPSPITTMTRSSNQDILTLKQAGYLLEYDQYQDHRPYKIRLTGHQLKVKIIIKAWTTIS